MVMNGGSKPLKAFHASVASEPLETPAFVYDEDVVADRAARIAALARQAGCRFLYSVKPCAQLSVVNTIGKHVDGFGVSSLFEARLCREDVSGTDASNHIHITTPCYPPREIDELSRYVDRITFNSIPQFTRFMTAVKPPVSIGLRANPEMSFLKGCKYDPCRPHSKLGVPIPQIKAHWKSDAAFRSALDGIHLHNNCGSLRLNELSQTAKHVAAEMPDILREMDWINLGGGYLYATAEEREAFIEAVKTLRAVSDAELVIEPGEALVAESGAIVSEVVDLFEHHGKRFAILDTTVNHMPEYFEYDLQPAVLGHDPQHRWRYVLAGATCLAGDVFGEYAFHDPLEVGSRIVMVNVGAYTLTKASLFNGVNLPTIYFRRGDGAYRCERAFAYEYYAERWQTGDHGYRRTGARVAAARQLHGTAATAP